VIFQRFARILCTILSIFIVNESLSIAWKQPRIIGLLQVRNESAIIEQCLRGLVPYADGIIVLDDASQDNTIEIIQSLAQELNVIKIIEREKSEWQVGSERNNRQKLLDEGRKAQGTHFILIDADEIFTACCLKDDWLRKKILTLRPGYIMTVPMVNLWHSIDVYRNDEFCNPNHWRWKEVTCILCDDGICDYKNNTAWAPSGTLHISREPANRKGVVKIEDINYGLIHFKAVNALNIKIKTAWYMMLEFIRLNNTSSIHNKTTLKKHAKQVNEFYYTIFKDDNLTDSKKIKLSPVPGQWYQGYDFLNPNPFKEDNETRKQDICAWINRYGIQYFSELNIWKLIDSFMTK